MIACKHSIHCGKRYSVKHNLRDFDAERWNKDSHISQDRTFLNSVMKNENLTEFFDENFGDALTDFNEKNYEKHPDRLIGFTGRTDYEKCPDEQKRERAVAAYLKQQKKAVQETIIQLGDHGEYEQLVQEQGRTKADSIYSEYLKSAYQHFVEKNPTLKVFCAAVHMDEVGNGTPHLHIDYLPIAQSERGLTCKVSMDGALKAMGFAREKQHKYAETPYKMWLKDRRTDFEDFAQSFANQNKLDMMILPSEKCEVRHEEPQVWRERQGRVKATKGRISALLGKDKKEQLAAAEFIISNSQAVAEGVTADAEQAKKQADAAKHAAEQLAINAMAEAEKAREEQGKAREEQKKAKESREIAEKARISAENDKRQVEQTVREQVSQVLSHSKRLQELTKETENRKQRYIQLGVRTDESSNRSSESMEIKQDQSLRTNRQQGVKR